MSTQPWLQFDPSARKHGMNTNSVAAHETVKYRKAATHQRIYDLLAKCSCGLTAKEIASAFGVPLHTISGRFSEMIAEGRIKRSSEKPREGSAVLVVAR